MLAVWLVRETFRVQVIIAVSNVNIPVVRSRNASFYKKNSELVDFNNQQKIFLFNIIIHFDKYNSVYFLNLSLRIRNGMVL